MLGSQSASHKECPQLGESVMSTNITTGWCVCCLNTLTSKPSILQETLTADCAGGKEKLTKHKNPLFLPSYDLVFPPVTFSKRFNYLALAAHKIIQN